MFFSFWFTSLCVTGCSSSTSLKLTQMCSFLWLSNVPLYICTQLLHPFIWRWTSKLPPCPSYCKQCCHEHWGTIVFSSYGFLGVYAQLVGLLSHMVVFFFFLVFFFFISWRLITLQYWSSFCHTLTRISHGFTCVPHLDPPSHFPLLPIPLGLPSAPGPSTCLMHPTWAGDLFHPR